MDQNFHEEEDVMMDIEQTRNDDFDAIVFLMAVMVAIGAQFQNSRKHLMGQHSIERPLRRPVTKLGEQYIQKVLNEDSQHFRVLYRMFPDVFLKLTSILKEKAGLEDTRFISVEEMLGIFMLTVGQNSRYCLVKDTFKRSKFAISTSFNRVLKALLVIAPSQMVKPNGLVPTKIRESTRFYPYFKNCVGAFDGTHIPAKVVGREVASYRNRKGTISQNVLAVCNFDLEFIYVLSGWEGSAHDSRVLNDALTRRTNNFQVPEGKFYLVDCGFANRVNFLAPFRGVRYHLQEFTGQGCDPNTASELFNLRHASLRNVIERIFGMFKSRFAIFKSAPPFSYQKQAGLVLACAALHNFLRKECRSDVGEFPVEENDQQNATNTNQVIQEEFLGTQEQDRENANTWRTTMAENMWRDAMNLDDP